MKYIVVGNIFSLVASILFGLSIFTKNKKNMTKYQIFNCFPSALSNYILGGITGALTNCVAAIRNYLVYKGINNNLITYLLIFLLIFSGIVFNHSGLIGFLPIIASAEYTIILCNKKNTFLKLKYSLLLNLFLWIIYDISIMAISATIIESTLAFLTIVAIIKNNELEKV